MRPKSLTAAVVLVLGVLSGLGLIAPPAHAAGPTPARASAQASAGRAAPTTTATGASPTRTSERAPAPAPAKVSQPRTASSRVRHVVVHPIEGYVPVGASAPVKSGTSASARPAAAQNGTAVPPGDNTVVNGPAALRVDACLPGDIAGQNRWSPNSPPCSQVLDYNGNPVAVPVGDYVTLRCWTTGPDDPYYSTSTLWIYVTWDTGTPETEYSGFMYGPLMSGPSVSTPNCDTEDFALYYPFAPGGPDTTIGIYNESGGNFTIGMNNIAFGPATVYCHLGTSDYPTGGTITYTERVTVNSSSLQLPYCGQGTQWVGLIASNGIIRYTGEVTIGSNASPPPPTPGYLGGVSGTPFAISSTNGPVVGSTIQASGLEAENFGQTNVTVSDVAFTVEDPNGAITYDTCDTNFTLAPGEIVECMATFTPRIAGTWILNLEWQGSNGSWTALYEPIDFQINPLPSPPANDDFGNATDLSGVTSFSGTNYGATAEPGEPDHMAGYAPSNSVWYKFTASMTGRAWVTMDDTDYAPVAVAAYTGDAVDDLTPLAEWDGDNEDQIAFLVTQGDVYYFAIDDWGTGGIGWGGPFAGTLEIDALNPPANDDFANAQPITPGDTYTTDFDDATTEPGEPELYPGYPDYGTVWYTYTPGPDQDVTMTLTSAGGNGGVVTGLFTGNLVSALNEDSYWYLDQSAGPAWTVTLSAGQTYYIALGDYIGPDQTSGIPDGLQFDLLASIAPVNDDFADATDITATGQITGDNTYATAEPGEPDHDPLGYAPSHSVWFEFTASASGRAWVTMDTTDYGFNDVAAYTGDQVGDLTQLATWDNEGDEEIAFLVTAGDVYYIAVDSFDGDGATGPFSGTLQIVAVNPPANDDFANAQPITSGTNYVTDLTDATVQPGEPVIDPNDPHLATVWYSYRPTEDIWFQLNVTGGDTGVYVGFYTGSAVNRLKVASPDTWLSQSQGDTEWTMEMSPGQTYDIDLSNWSTPDTVSGVPGPGEFAFKATVKPQPPVVTTVLPTLYTGEHYTIQLHAKDGTPPYSWRLNQPSNRTGWGTFTLSRSGVLSGSSPDAGQGSFDILVTDSQNPKVTWESWLTERVVVDDTPPTGHITKIATGKGSLKVYWAATDKQSGYNYARIRIERIVTSGKQPPWTTTGDLPGTSATLRVAISAQYRIEIRFVDKSGNVSAWTTAKTVTVHT